MAMLLCLGLASPSSSEPREVRVNLQRPSHLLYRLDQADSPWVNLPDAGQGSAPVLLPDQDVILQAWADEGFTRYFAERRVLSSAQVADLGMSSGWHGLRVAAAVALVALFLLAANRRRWRTQASRLRALEALGTEDGDAWIGRVLKDYRILSRLGRGGMGVVYLAERLSPPAEQVALKLLPLDGVQPLVLERFQRECLLASRLHHPHLVQVLDFGQSELLHYLVLEYVEGSTLRRLMPSSGLELSQALPWMLAIAQAICYCHDRGVLHCDLKPENIMVTNQGQVKILDFGLAREEMGHQLTPLDSLVGTPCYLAPERFSRVTRKPTPAVDQYALGVLFFEMLAGRPPFVSEDLRLYASLHQTQEVPSLQELRPDLPNRLVETIGRMLEKQPESRFHSLHEVVVGLSQPAPFNQDTIDS